MGISVVIPAHDAAPWLAEAIGSVIAQEVPAQIIVVDDGSSDETAEVAARFAEVQVLRHNASRGPSAARNTGARAATNDAVLFLDADDRLLPGALAHAAACMAANPQAAFVYGAHRRVDADWHPQTPPALERCGPDARLAFLRTNCVGMIATALFDRAKLLAVGHFDEALHQCEDYDLFLRLALRWPVACHTHLMPNIASTAPIPRAIRQGCWWRRGRCRRDTSHLIRPGRRRWREGGANGRVPMHWRRGATMRAFRSRALPGKGGAWPVLPLLHR